MAFDDTITENIKTSLAEIPHPSLPKGSSIYGGTKIFPDYQAEEGERFILDRVPFVVQAYEAIYDKLAEMDAKGATNVSIR